MFQISSQTPGNSSLPSFGQQPIWHALRYSSRYLLDPPFSTSPKTSSDANNLFYSIETSLLRNTSTVCAERRIFQVFVLTLARWKNF
jgi:hypothetical protein